jgi:hypothetical protein
MHADRVAPTCTTFSLHLRGAQIAWQDVRGSPDEPSPFVNIEFNQTFASHFQ